MEKIPLVFKCLMHDCVSLHVRITGRLRMEKIPLVFKCLMHECVARQQYRQIAYGEDTPCVQVFDAWLCSVMCQDHKRTHAEKTPFVCEVCGSGFQSRSNLHSHVLHRHKEEKKHCCDRCDRTFKTR